VEKDFLTFLVDETMNLSGDLTSLEHKLQDYELQFLRGEFIPQLRMLRFQTVFGALDIPINWSVFEDTKPEGIVIDASSDEGHLFKVLRSAWDFRMKQILVTHADGFCYLVGFKAGEEVHLRDIMNPQEILKAA
jgi:hypothetical protein